VRQGASWTAASHLQLTAAAVVRPVLVVLCAELSWVVARPDGACPGGASSRHPASGVVAVIDTARTPAMASVAGRRPACGVHPSGVVRDPRRPCGVRPAGFIVRGSGGPAVCRPPSGVRPSAVRPVCPDASSWSHPGRCARQPSPQEPSRSRWAAAPSSGSVDGRAGLGRAPLPSPRVGQWGSVANLAGVVAGRRRPRVTLSDRAGQAGVRSARRCGGAVARERAAARGGRACRVAAALGLGGRPRWVMVVAPAVGVDGPARADGLADGDGDAAPARPRLTAGVPGSLPAAL
jgi:hypothetical protein